MKVTKSELGALRALIAPLDTEIARARYREGLIARADAVKDIDKRYRWDLFWTVRGMDALTGDYIDVHIDTALRAIVKPLKGELSA